MESIIAKYAFMHGCVRLRDALKCISKSDTTLTAMVHRTAGWKAAEHLAPGAMHQRLHAHTTPAVGSCRDFAICSWEYLLRALQA